MLRRSPGCSSRSSSIRSSSPSSSASWCATRGTGPGSRSSTRTGSRRCSRSAASAFDVEQIFDQAAEDVELVRLDREDGRQAARDGRGARRRRHPGGVRARPARHGAAARVLLRTTESEHREPHRGEGAGARLHGQPRAAAGVHRSQPRVRRPAARGGQRRLLRGRVRGDRPERRRPSGSMPWRNRPIPPCARRPRSSRTSSARRGSLWRPRTSRCGRPRTRSSSSRKRAAAARCSCPRTCRPTPWR